MKTYNLIKITTMLLIIVITCSVIIYVTNSNMNEGAVAVFRTNEIYGDVLVYNYRDGVKIKAYFTKLPSGKHGFHIHKAGDLRGEGCQGLCEHYDTGKNTHGDSPEHGGERHTGDLGNIELKDGKYEKEYYIKGINVTDLWGRSIIIHKDEDDLGMGSHEDSKTTGHSGARIGCAIFGRSSCKPKYNKTRKNKHF
jgi:Cu-Zn family superoxide dismutase